MINQKEKAKIFGTIKWKVIDLNTGLTIRESEKRNLITDRYVESIADAAGGGSIMQVNQIQIGTTNTTFTASSNALTSPLQTLSVTGVVSGKSITFNAIFVFTSPATIEEMGLFDSVPDAVALTNSISEGVNANQALNIEWTITHNN
jgi:hypothetical protein